MSRLRAMALLAVCCLVVAGCKDSSVNISEQKIANPPGVLNRPGSTPPGGGADPTPTVRPPLPPVGEFEPRRRPSIPKPVNVPDLPVVPARPNGPKKAKLEFIEVGTTNIVEKIELGEEDFIHCKRVFTGLTAEGEAPVVPLWQISFEKKDTAEGKTKPSLEINYYGELKALGKQKLTGSGTTVWAKAKDGRTNVTRKSNLVVSWGDEETSALRFENRFENASYKGVSTTCEILVDRLRDGQISGRFLCDQLKNHEHKWMNIIGEFECPYWISSIYPLTKP